MLNNTATAAAVALPMLALIFMLYECTGLQLFVESVRGLAGRKRRQENPGRLRP
jgi:hypothetical protein